MQIIFTDWDNWKDIVDKIQKGFIPCPRCNQWRDYVYKIPERYRSELNLTISYNIKYCCDYCMAELAENYKWQNSIRCAICHHRFRKDDLIKVKIRNWIQDVCLRCADQHNKDKAHHKLMAREKNRVRTQNMRTAVLGLASTLTLDEWLLILEKYNWKCAYCTTKDFQEMDHVLPVSRGGGTTFDNVVPSCSFCNSDKSDRINYSDQLRFRLEVQ